MDEGAYAVVAGRRIPATALAEAGLGWEAFAAASGRPLDFRFVDALSEPASWTLPLPAGGVVGLARRQHGWEAERRTMYENRAVLRQVLARAVLDEGGLLLHAAGVVARDRAWIFVGPSGAGKTTLSDQSKGVVLSDDVVVVYPSGPTASGTPFTSDGGRTGNPRSARAGALITLAWADSVRAERLSQSAGFRAVLGNAFVAPIEADRMRLAAQFAGKLAASLPTYRLWFPRDYVFDPRDLDVP